jgi:DNA-binding PadR family transcriptional regulator
MQSLAKKGLVTAAIVERVASVPPLGIRGPPRMVKEQAYYLTPAGLEAYLKMREKWHQSKLKRLESEYKTDLARARGRTKAPEEEAHAGHP